MRFTRPTRQPLLLITTLSPLTTTSKPAKPSYPTAIVLVQVCCNTGNYWAIHPACVDSFARGDYRRRHARRRAVASKMNRHCSPPPLAAASESNGNRQLLGTCSQDANEYTAASQVVLGFEFC